jgi:hypothetical protein
MYFLLDLRLNLAGEEGTDKTDGGGGMRWRHHHFQASYPQHAESRDAIKSRGSSRGFFLSRLLPDLYFLLYAVVEVACSPFFFSLRHAPISERAVSALAEQVLDGTLE